MNLIEEDDGLIRYFRDLKDCEPEYKAYKCYSILQFYALLGTRKTIISLENLEPIPDLHYVMKGVASEKGEENYFFRGYRNYPLEHLLFKENNSIFEGDLAENIFVSRIKMGLIWVLYTAEQVEMLKQMCARIWKSQRADEGTLSYRDWIRLAELTINRDYYKAHHSSDIDYKTKLRMYETEIKKII